MNGETRIPVAQWLREGLRAGFFLRPRVGPAVPGPLQLLAIFIVTAALDVAAARLEFPGAATFDLRAWLVSWWGMALTVLLVWWTLLPRATADWSPDDGPRHLAAWFALWLGAALPAELVSQGLSIAQAYEVLPRAMSTRPWLAWGVYLLLWAWTLGVAVRLARNFGAPRLRLAVLLLGLAGIFALSVWQVPDRWWRADETQAAEKPRLRLSQETFEAQQALWRQTEASIKPAEAGAGNVYGIVFAPYAAEDVFLRESTLVAEVLAGRFGADGRVIHLVNHATTAGTRLWATPANLERAIALLAGRMDLASDILVVYLTSHGASDFRLAAEHWPLEVQSLTPQQLRQALDKAGVRHRVIAVSACYSGGWVDPLANDATLVMTAADATHTSYGCGRLSELTFFGRAMWDEQLRKTHSFEKAFNQAVPIIRQREIDAGKSDGFSNPQIRMGSAIAPVLKALEQRLDSPAK